MKSKNILKYVAYGTLLTLMSLLTVILPIGNFETDELDDGGGLSLVKPAFAQTSAGSFLQGEAGIAAYVNTGSIIDPSTAKSVFKIIEMETAEYIIGSVSVEHDDYDSGIDWTHDVHAFVHKDGWIVTYYLKSEPVSKMIGYKYHASGALNTNYLTEGLTRIGSTFGIAITNPKYYHFQYPGANRITKIVGSDYKVKIPGNFQVFEVSLAWGHMKSYYETAHIGGDSISLSQQSDPHFKKIGLDQLAPGVLQDIKARSHYDSTFNISILILYLEP